MKNVKSVVILTSIAVLAFAACASAWDGHGRGHGGKRFWELLTPDQDKQAKAMHLAFLKKIQPLRAEMGKKAIELRELAYQDNPDETAIQKKKQEMWTLQDQMRTDRRGLQTQLRSMLTPEQRNKIGPFGPRLGGGKERWHGRRADSDQTDGMRQAKWEHPTDEPGQF
jgi:Spy/CpxP family protein refolding chaperone